MDHSGRLPQINQQNREFWKRQSPLLPTRLRPSSGERIVDIATGTGWTSRAVARSGAETIGIDIAAELLSAART